MGLNSEIVHYVLELYTHYQIYSGLLGISDIKILIILHTFSASRLKKKFVSEFYTVTNTAEHEVLVSVSN